MKINLLKNRKQRGKIFALITLVGIVGLFLLNILMKHVGLYGSLYLDMTPEGLYTVSEAMREECAFIDELEDGEKEVRVIFCSDPDTLIGSQMTRVPYLSLLKLDAALENLSVETVNITYNPTAVAEYKTTSLSTVSPTDIIISYGDKYRILNAASLWYKVSGEYYSYNGEYRLASLLVSVTAVEKPKAYFVTNHGERYYDIEDPESAMSLETAYLYDLVVERGMDVGLLNLAEEDIPEDCVLLIINNPSHDFTVPDGKLGEYSYESETDKLDRYLVKTSGSIMVARDYSRPLENFDDFLYEWGFAFGTSLVSDEGGSLQNEEGTYTDIIGVYDTSEDSYGYSIYGNFASLSSAPLTVIPNTGYVECSFGDRWSVPEAGTYSTSRNYAPLFYSSPDASAHELSAGGGYTDLDRRGKMHLAAVSTRLELDSYTRENKYSYIFCVNSPDFFSSEVLGEPSYANYDVMSSLISNMVRTDGYASIDLGGLSQNSKNMFGKILYQSDISATDVYATDKSTGKQVLVWHGLSSSDAIGITVGLMLIPLAVAVAAVAVRIRRKFL